MHRESDENREIREAKAAEFLASESFQEIFYEAVDAGLKGAKFAFIEMLPVNVSGTKALREFRAAVRATGIYDVVDFNLDEDRLGIEVQFGPRPIHTPLRKIKFSGWFGEPDYKDRPGISWGAVKDAFNFQSAREERISRFLESKELLEKFNTAIEEGVKRGKKYVELFDLGFYVGGTKAFAEFRKAARAKGIHDVVPFRSGYWNRYSGLEIQFSPRPLHALAMKLHLVS